MATNLKDVSSDVTPSDLTNQIDTLRGDLSTLKQIVTDLGKSKADDALSAVKAKATEAKDVVVDQTETARLHAMELQGQAGDFIKTRPATALCVAAGLGFLVGYLSQRD